MILFLEKKRAHISFKLLSVFLILSFLLSSVVYFNRPSSKIYASFLPAPGQMLHLSSSFVPALLKGVTIHPDDPFRFDFIIEDSDEKLTDDEFKRESQQLIKYFLASLTIPEDDIWVNLSPYEQNRVTPYNLGITELGKSLLSQDYILKQLLASLMYPESSTGKKFWKRVYEKAYQLYGTTNIPINTFNKVWIMPAKAVVETKDNTAYVAESRLKVLLEEDYLALKENVAQKNRDLDKISKDEAEGLNRLTSSVVKEVILPVLEEEINYGKNFAQLRQAYHALILAVWFKQKLKEHIVNQIYTDKRKVKGVDLEDKEVREKIYRQYLEAYKKGVYDYVKTDYDLSLQKEISRRYYGGGFALGEGWLESREVNRPSRLNEQKAHNVEVALASSSIEDSVDNVIKLPETRTSEESTQAASSTITISEALEKLALLSGWVTTALRLKSARDGVRFWQERKNTRKTAEARRRLADLEKLPVVENAYELSDAPSVEQVKEIPFNFEFEIVLQRRREDGRWVVITTGSKDRVMMTKYNFLSNYSDIDLSIHNHPGPTFPSTTDLGADSDSGEEMDEVADVILISGKSGLMLVSIKDISREDRDRFIELIREVATERGKQALFRAGGNLSDYQQISEAIRKAQELSSRLKELAQRAKEESLRISEEEIFKDHAGLIEQMRELGLVINFYRWGSGAKEALQQALKTRPKISSSSFSASQQPSADKDQEEGGQRSSSTSSSESTQPEDDMNPYRSPTYIEEDLPPTIFGRLASWWRNWRQERRRRRQEKEHLLDTDRTFQEDKVVVRHLKEFLRGHYNVQMHHTSGHISAYVLMADNVPVAIKQEMVDYLKDFIAYPVGWHPNVAIGFGQAVASGKVPASVAEDIRRHLLAVARGDIVSTPDEQKAAIHGLNEIARDDNMPLDYVRELIQLSEQLIREGHPEEMYLFWTIEHLSKTRPEVISEDLFYLIREKARAASWGDSIFGIPHAADALIKLSENPNLDRLVNPKPKDVISQSEVFDSYWRLTLPYWQFGRLMQIKILLAQGDRAVINDLENALRILLPFQSQMVYSGSYHQKPNELGFLVLENLYKTNNHTLTAQALSRYITEVGPKKVTKEGFVEFMGGVSSSTSSENQQSSAGKGEEEDGQTASSGVTELKKPASLKGKLTVTGAHTPVGREYVSVWEAVDELDRKWFVKPVPKDRFEAVMYYLADVAGVNIPDYGFIKLSDMEGKDYEYWVSKGFDPEEFALVTRDVNDLKENELIDRNSSGIAELLAFAAWIRGLDFSTENNFTVLSTAAGRYYFIYDPRILEFLIKQPQQDYEIETGLLALAWQDLDPKNLAEAVERIQKISPKAVADQAQKLGGMETQRIADIMQPYLNNRNPFLGKILSDALATKESELVKVLGSGTDPQEIKAKLESFVQHLVSSSSSQPTKAPASSGVKQPSAGKGAAENGQTSSTSSSAIEEQEAVKQVAEEVLNTYTNSYFRLTPASESGDKLYVAFSDGGLEELANLLSERNWYFRGKSEEEITALLRERLDSFSSDFISKLERLVAEKLQIDASDIITIASHGSSWYEDDPSDVDLMVVVRTEGINEQLLNVEIDPQEFFSEGRFSQIRKLDMRVVSESYYLDRKYDSDKARDKQMHEELMFWGHGVILRGKDYWHQPPTMFNLIKSIRQLILDAFARHTEYFSGNEEYALSKISRRWKEMKLMLDLLFSDSYAGKVKDINDDRIFGYEKLQALDEDMQRVLSEADINRVGEILREVETHLLRTQHIEDALERDASNELARVRQVHGSEKQTIDFSRVTSEDSQPSDKLAVASSSVDFDHETVEIPFFASDAPARAVQAISQRKAVVFNLKDMPILGSLDEEAKAEWFRKVKVRVEQIVIRLPWRLRTENIFGTNIAHFIREILKNAFTWGNHFNSEFSIGLHMQLDEQNRCVKVEVYDAGLKGEPALADRKIAKRTDVDLSGAGVGLEGTRRFTNYERLEGVVSDQSGYGFQTVASISPKGKSSSTVAELKKFVNKNKNNPFVYVVTLVATGDKPAFSPDEPSKENLRLLDQLVQDLRKRLFPVDSVILNNKNVLVYNSPSVREIARGPNRELYKDSIGGFDLDEKQDLESFLKDIFETPDQGELRGYPTIQKPLGSTHYVDIRVGKQHVFGYKFPPNMLDRVRTNTNKYIESLVRITDEPIYVVIARDLRPKEKEELRQVLTELKQGDKLTPLDVEAIIRDNILGGQVYFNQHSHGLPQDYKYFWADSRFFRIADSLVEQVGFKAAFKFTLNGLRKHILTGRMSAMETGLSVLADSSQKARLQSNRHELANIIGQIEAENRQILEKGSSPGSKGDRTQSSSTSLEKTAKDLEARIQGETRNLIGAIGQNGKLKPETINISLSMDGNRGSLLVTSNEEAISWISFVLWRHKGKTTLTIDQQNTMIAYQGTGLMKYLQSHIFEAFDVDMVKYTKVTKAGRKFAGNLANGTNNIFTHIENLKARDLVAHVNKAGLREFLNQQERSSSSSDSSSPSSQLTQEQAAEGRSVSSSTKGNQDLGGIDLSPANLDLEVRGGSIDLPQFKVPFDLQTFEGFTFRILKIEPIKSLNKEVSRR